LDDKYLKAHRFSSRHREELEKDTLCGCFHCTKIFRPAEITEWIDDDDTALCPYCGIDSVIGESSGLPITEHFLKEMHRAWF
jgi:DNA-directed RNA polymerase subunit RPC12/RpoP